MFFKRFVSTYPLYRMLLCALHCEVSIELCMCVSKVVGPSADWHRSPLGTVDGRDRECLKLTNRLIVGGLRDHFQVNRSILRSTIRSTTLQPCPKTKPNPFLLDLALDQKALCRSERIGQVEAVLLQIQLGFWQDSSDLGICSYLSNAFRSTPEESLVSLADSELFWL